MTIQKLISDTLEVIEEFEKMCSEVAEKTSECLQRITVIYIAQETSEIPKYSQKFHFFGYSLQQGIIRVSCSPNTYRIGQRLSGVLHEKQRYLFPGTIKVC